MPKLPKFVTDLVQRSLFQESVLTPVVFAALAMLAGRVAILRGLKDKELAARLSNRLMVGIGAAGVAAARQATVSPAKVLETAQHAAELTAAVITPDTAGMADVVPDTTRPLVDTSVKTAVEKVVTGLPGRLIGWSLGRLNPFDGRAAA